MNKSQEKVANVTSKESTKIQLMDNETGNKTNKQSSHQLKETFLNTIDHIRIKQKQRPDSNAIYHQLIRSGATNINLESVRCLIQELMNENVIFNKTSHKGYESFYRFNPITTNKCNSTIMSSPMILLNETSVEEHPLYIAKSPRCEITDDDDDKNSDMNIQLENINGKKECNNACKEKYDHYDFSIQTNCESSLGNQNLPTSTNHNQFDEKFCKLRNYFDNNLSVLNEKYKSISISIEKAIEIEMLKTKNIRNKSDQLNPPISNSFIQNVNEQREEYDKKKQYQRKYDPNIGSKQTHHSTT